MFDYFDKISILVVPTDMCNMNCKYCYHEAHFTSNTKMSLEVMEKLIAISVPNYKEIHFIWHGGEPLLMGIDFFKRALDLQEKYNVNNAKVTNSIQTNLLLMTSKFANFFVEKGFGIGGSFDGCENDFTRGKSNEILVGRKILQECGGTSGNIMVVSRLNISTLIESYEFFKTNKINYKMNMYIKTDDSEMSRNMALSADEYSSAMIALFEHYFFDTDCNIRVGTFEQIISYILFRRKNICCYTSCLGKWLGVRYNGLITNCNRYYPKEYYYGNIINMSDIREAFESEGFNNMLKKSIERRKKCKECEIFDYCSGGCNNITLFENGMENNGGVSCLALKAIYKYINKKINEIKYKDINKININPMIVRMIRRFQAGAQNYAPDC